MFVAMVAALSPHCIIAQEVLPSDTLRRQRAFDYYYLQALSLKEQGVHDAALEMFEHCATIDPTSPALLFELSTYYMYLGKKNEALDMMQEAVKREPKNFWYRQILATAYENNGQSDDALLVYEAMAADFPTNSELYLIIAGYHAERQDYEKALAALNSYELKEGKSEQISMQKYNLCLQMPDSVLALKEMEKLVVEHPDDITYKVYKGNVYLSNGNYTSAYKIYKEVLSQEPDNVEAQVGLVNYYDEQDEDSLLKQSLEQLLLNEKLSASNRSELLLKTINRLEESGGDSLFISGICERLKALPGNQLSVITIYAQWLTMKGASEEHISPLLQKILEYEPENRMAQLQLLSYAISRRDYADIITRADTAILYNPEMLQLYYYRGIACYQMKRPEEALATFRTGLKKRGEDTKAELISELFTLVGDTEHELGNNKATLEAYDSALVYNPRNIVVLNNYAYYLALDDSNLVRAEEMSYKTIKEEPENPIYVDTYMWILFKQQRYEEAKAYAEKLMLIDNEKSAVEYSHCGDIFAMCGDIERALDCWIEAQNLGDDSKILKRKIKKKRYIPDGKKKKKK